MLQSEVTANGVSYTAKEGSLIYGIVLPNNTPDCFASVKVEVLRNGNILADGSLSSQEIGL